MNRTPLLALLLPLALSPLASLGAPAYAATTCHGLPVTLQGTPGAQVQGTQATTSSTMNGAQGVAAGPGDDTVCITNGGTYTEITADEGNDYVEVDRAQEVSAILGAGADTFLGGTGDDSVIAGENGDDTLVRRYSIDCGPGDSGGRDQSDVLRGGPGNDVMIGSQGPDVLLGDSGRDRDRAAAAASIGAWPRSGRAARSRERPSRDYRGPVQINVNGQNYDRWEDVPAEVRQQLAATLPDADKNGVPDLFETGALPPGAQTFSSASIMVNGQTVRSASDLPPEIQEELHQALGMLGPMFGGTSTSTTAVFDPNLPSPPDAGAPVPATPPPAVPLQPGQVMLNGVPTTVGDATPAKKGFWRRLFGG